MDDRSVRLSRAVLHAAQAWTHLRLQSPGNAVQAAGHVALAVADLEDICGYELPRVSPGSSIPDTDLARVIRAALPALLDDDLEYALALLTSVEAYFNPQETLVDRPISA